MEFKHIPVLLDECIEALQIKPNSIILDGTLGGGGHSAVILGKLKSGKLIGIDKDEQALKFTSEKFKKNSNFIGVKSDFKDFEMVLNNLKINKVDGILLDLGVSSYQLDNKERGFSYISDAPLDMRMDISQEFSAYNVVNDYSENDLSKIFFEYGEEKFSRQIARKIVERRKEAKIKTTKELSDIIIEVIPKGVIKKGGNPCKRAFQAIRIEVNGELDKLFDCIVAMVNRLNSGGRLAIISFHSLEDRIVKNAFKECITGCICPPHMPICVCNHKAIGKLINKKPIEASELEIEQNSRSKSAKLRVIEKL